MPSYNRVAIMGHVGGEPDLRVTAKGMSLLKFSLATNRHIPTGDNEWREETDWHNVVVFGHQAERHAARMQKGDLVLDDGRLSHRTWKTEEGEPRSRVEVVGQLVRVLGRLARRPGPMAPLYDEDSPFASGAPLVAATSATPTPAPGASVDADIPF